MDAFLKLVANDLYSRFGNTISSLTLIFPSQRASLFFNRHLSGLLSKPIWLPKTESLGNLMFQISGLRPVDHISLIFKLYDVYREQLKSQESFDSFYFWGEVMHADFDQIDKFRVNPDNLFTNIRNLKDIEQKFGGFTPEQIESIKKFFLGFSDSDSQLKERYLKIWNSLGAIYHNFQLELLNNGLGYEGLAYRRAADMLEKNHDLLSDNPIAFIGFNALNDCEKTLFQHVKLNGKALFYWDYDPYYVENDLHEAGTFIRSNLKLFPNSLKVDSSSNFDDEKEVFVVSTPSAISQTKVVPMLLNKILNLADNVDINSAIVLPDENLLLSVLSAIPEEFNQVNVTMGYPVRETPAYALAENIIQLLIGSRKGNNEIHKYYYKNIQSVINHPYVQLIDPDACNEINKWIIAENVVYVDKQVLEKSKLTSLIFTFPESEATLAKYLCNIFNEIASGINTIIKENENHSLRIDLEFVYSVVLALNRLSDNMALVEFDIGIKVFHQLFRKALAQQRVSFNGEPLSGIQVMGFLETRTLDFENIIILSVNDDVLPGKKSQPSFITPSVRYAYNLPDIQHQNAIYSYYFFRSIQRSKRIYLVYTDKAEGISSGEISRYALELQYDSKVKLNFIDIKFDLGIVHAEPISVQKNERVIEKLNQFCDSSVSGKRLYPTALSKYIECPLMFYFNVIAGIRKPKEVLEEVDIPGFGQIIHKSMEMLYGSIGGHEVTKNDIENLINNSESVNSIIEKAFIEVYCKSEKNALPINLSGRNQLILSLVKKLINRILVVDMSRAPFIINALEQAISSVVELDTTEGKRLIRMGGVIDRLEVKNNTAVIVDYKTGGYNTKGSYKLIDELFNPKNSKKSKDIFQIFTYCYLLKNETEFVDIIPQLWYVRNAATDYMPGVICDKELVLSFNLKFQEFHERLMILLSEIFDTTIPFTQTKNSESCKYCDYSIICQRSG